MNQNRICSFVEDLLPLYAEGLVSEKSKEEIRKHLKECDKCRKTLEDIRKDNDLFLMEEDNDEETKSNREVKCIKNIKRKIISRTIVAILLSIILTSFLAYIWDTYRIIKNDDGKYIIYNIKTGNIKIGINGTNILAEYTISNNDQDLKYNVILTFNENDVCINARAKISGYDKSELENFISAWQNSIVVSNIKVENDNLYLNDNVYIGKEKQEIIESLKDYNAVIIDI